MKQPEITDDVALAEEIEHLVKLAQENDIPDHEIRGVLDRAKQLTNDETVVADAEYWLEQVSAYIDKQAEYVYDEVGEDITVDIELGNDIVRITTFGMDKETRAKFIRGLERGGFTVQSTTKAPIVEVSVRDVEPLSHEYV